MTVSIIAHRTCMLDCPENSLAGIRKAAELGADGVEIDVRPTLDGKVVLMHDWSPRRTTGLPGPVAWYHSFFLRRVRLRGEGSERVPTLDEALDALPEGLLMAVEIKDAGAAPRVLEALRARKLDSRVLMWSYREAAVRYFAQRAPEIEPALLRDDTDPEGLRRFLLDATECGARAISAHWDAISPQFAGEAHDRNLRVFSMNRDMESIPKRVAAGLDGIVTDRPREVREVLASLPAAPPRQEPD